MGRRGLQADEHGAEVPLALNVLTHAVIGAAIEVHSVLGPGLLERMYEEALVHELGRVGLDVQRQVPVVLPYKGLRLEGLRLDLIVAEQLVLELKAVDAVAPVHLSQLLSYMRAARCPLGLLINFNVPRLIDGVHRRVNSSVLAASPMS